ncbi:hypothetical protein C8N46_10957 [Kordia periserrulae]|uniref:Uncharacterized protein n=1 Tax=Kordia periserrulae TaxID=701523 RepID=A0A2T6BTQ5_9FLAO|nr:hypothetical protein [Kordia periserrulae]PTX59468.1 hypothetical protein C8N46_10957 [Kordia periserrulae]
MKKKNLKLLKLSKKSIANFNERKLKGGMSRSQCNSQCGYSCDPNLCGNSIEPWCVKDDQ